MKFGNAKIEPFISVEGPGTQAPAQLADRPAASGPLNEYEEQIMAMRRDATDLYRSIQSLRLEAERLVSWCIAGEGAEWWGTSQTLYAAQTRTQNCVAATELKACAEKKFDGQSQRLFDRIFSEPSQFGDAITIQARKELGL